MYHIIFSSIYNSISILLSSEMLREYQHITSFFTLQMVDTSPVPKLFPAEFLDITTYYSD